MHFIHCILYAAFFIYLFLSAHENSNIYIGAILVLLLRYVGGGGGGGGSMFVPFTYPVYKRLQFFATLRSNIFFDFQQITFKF